jgi:DNA-binding transcriptional LysR family regulator
LREIALRVERAIEEIRAAAVGTERRDLRLGMIDTFACTVGPLLVRTLIDGAVALRVTAFSGLMSAHTEALLHDAIDAAVTSDPMEGLHDLNRFALFREPFVLAAPIEWGNTVRDRSLADVLRRHKLIRYSARSHMGAQIEQHLRRLRIEHPQALSFDTSDSLLATVANGAGVAITTPLGILQAAVHRPALDVISLPSPGFSRTVMLVTRRSELDTLGSRIAEAARTLLRTSTLLQIAQHIPWMAEMAGTMVLDALPGDQAG